MRHYVRESLGRAYEEFQALYDQGETTEVITEGEDDFATVADKRMTEALEGYFEDQGDFNVLSEEGSKNSSDSEYTVIIDEFDGTANMIKGAGELPFGPVVAIAEGSNPDFEDVIASGYLELNSGNFYEAERDSGAEFYENATSEVSEDVDLTEALNSQEPVQLDASDRESMEGEEPASMIIDLYMLGDDASTVVERFNDKAYLGDYRSWAEHMALVARGQYDAAITADRNALNPDKRATAEELAAGYLLVNEAGGVITDWQGRDIGNGEIGFERGKTFDVVVSGTQEFAKKIADELPE